MPRPHQNKYPMRLKPSCVIMKAGTTLAGKTQERSIDEKVAKIISSLKDREMRMEETAIKAALGLVRGGRRTEADDLLRKNRQTIINLSTSTAMQILGILRDAIEGGDDTARAALEAMKVLDGKAASGWKHYGELPENSGGALKEHGSCVP